MGDFLRELKLKRDFAATIERFEAWWQGEIIDRPPVTLAIKPSRLPAERASVNKDSLRDRWMNVRRVVDDAVAWLECYDYAGDALPIFWPNLGPEITASVLGVELEFGPATSWSTPIVHAIQDWQRVLDRPVDFGNVYWQTIEAMIDYAFQINDGRYLIGITDLHGNYDILAALRDPEALCLDLMDDPALVARAGHRAAEIFTECFNRQYAKLSSAGMGCTTWTGYYHAGPAYVPSCDFWCMTSERFAREIILPDILTEMRPLERSLFHLDGPQALRHLDLLLEIPQLSAVQWVYGEGNGPAAKWIAVYKRILQAGKSVQVLAEGPADALEVLDALGPCGLWLQVGGQFATVPAAEEFLNRVSTRTRRGHG